MKILMPKLNKDHETLWQCLEKLLEEQEEVHEAAYAYKIWGKAPERNKLISEIFDEIQVLLNMLQILERKGADIEKESREHLLKLVNRHQFIMDGFYQITKLD